MLSYYLLDITAIDSTFSPLRPSVKAASAVALSSALISQMESTSPATVAIDLITSTSAPTDTTNTFVKGVNAGGKSTKRTANVENQPGDFNRTNKKLCRETDTVGSITSSSDNIMTSAVVKTTIDAMLKAIQCKEGELLGGIRKMVHSLVDAELSTYQVREVTFKQHFLKIYTQI